MTSARALLIVILCLPLAAGCTQFPDLDRTLTPALEARDYPALVPLGPVLKSAQDSAIDPVREADIIDARVSTLQSRASRIGTVAPVDARAAALRARAARLRGAVLSGPERQRLSSGLQ